MRGDRGRDGGRKGVREGGWEGGEGRPGLARGLAMGSSISAILAIILNPSHLITSVPASASTCMFTRYVDDIFLFAKNHEDAEQIHEVFNNIPFSTLSSQNCKSKPQIYI